MNLRLQVNEQWPKEGVLSNVCEVVHKRPEQYLAELMMIFRDKRILEIPSFWKLHQYAKTYEGFLLQIKKRLSYCDFIHLHNAILKNKMSSFQGDADDMIAQEISDADVS